MAHARTQLSCEEAVCVAVLLGTDTDTLVIASDMLLQSLFLFRLEHTFITCVDNPLMFSSLVTKEFVFYFCFVLAHLILVSDTFVLTANMTFKMPFPVSLK